jgi:hypothetical protein
MLEDIPDKVFFCSKKFGLNSSQTWFQNHRLLPYQYSNGNELQQQIHLGYEFHTPNFVIIIQTVYTGVKGYFVS